MACTPDRCHRIGLARITTDHGGCVPQRQLSNERISPRYNNQSTTKTGAYPLLRTRTIVACLVILRLSCIAQEHAHGSDEKLGVVRFSNSCKQEAQPELDRAVALLHSFEFSRAVAGFNAALKNDPTCGIAYWGIALSDWSNPFAPG